MSDFPLDPLALLTRLVAIDTTSARSNLPLIELLEEQLARLGFDHTRQEWTDANGVRKANLIAQRTPSRGEAGERAGLALVGHSDCVPFDPTWSGALAGNIHESKLYGRGSADTKGFIAAALAAAARAPAHRAPLMVIITADEEVGCLGAKRLLEFFANSQLGRPRRAIIGEPTRMIPVRGHKGYCLSEIEITGAEGHSAYPDTGASAILAAGRLLQEIEEIAGTLKDTADPLFNPPYTTLNVGLIQGGSAKNVIPGSCRLTLEWRPLPGQDASVVLTALERSCARLSTGRIHAAVKPIRLDAGVAAPVGELIEFLQTQTKNLAETIPFGTELPQLALLGAESCVFGPGDIRVAHRTGEFAPVEEVNAATEILAAAIERFCR